MAEQKKVTTRPDRKTLAKSSGADRGKRVLAMRVHVNLGKDLRHPRARSQ